MCGTYITGHGEGRVRPHCRRSPQLRREECPPLTTAGCCRLLQLITGRDLSCTENNPGKDYNSQQAVLPALSVVHAGTCSCPTGGEPMTGEHLHRAVNMNDEVTVLKILQTGNVKADIPDKLGFSPLMIAAQKGYFRIVQSLIDHGADINLENGSGKNSVMLACFAGHLDIVEYLREQGASWESRDKGGCTAMHWAVDGGSLKLIEWMIGDGCEVDVKDSCSHWTPLMRVSAVTGSADVARLLIAAGANINVKDKDGKTPLMVATLNNHERLVRLLIEKGADCSITNEYGIGISEMAKAFNRQISVGPSWIMRTVALSYGLGPPMLSRRGLIDNDQSWRNNYMDPFGLRLSHQI
ncbi:fibronectin type 3 and ankyrin repeat domains protein 1 isoform X6 [Dendrobates tinctorius]|uniref:fibronectin type 3 and ankyrin repeat domains protein 1 isoform X6 n=1 Tax=Dendrobates tinctorius TaxID=92724 RepID=UPI003CCA04CC